MRLIGPQVCSSGLIPANWPRAALISREGKAHGCGRWKSPGLHVSVKQEKTRLSGRPIVPGTTRKNPEQTGTTEDGS